MCCYVADHQDESGWKWTPVHGTTTDKKLLGTSHLHLVKLSFLCLCVCLKVDVTELLFCLCSKALKFVAGYSKPFGSEAYSVITARWQQKSISNSSQRCCQEQVRG